MTYDPNSSRKGGARKRLIEEVIKQVDNFSRGSLGSFSALQQIVDAVSRYKKEMGK